MKGSAVVLLSGGLDSTTALYWGRSRFDSLQALTFDYGQKHRIEVEMAERIAVNLNLEFHKFEIPLQNLTKSALLDRDLEIPESLADLKDTSSLPITYVPFRNGILLSLAVAFAEPRKIFNIIVGFNSIDNPDYPDTTEHFVSKLADVINTGTSSEKMGNRFYIHAPLIKKTKKEIVEMGIRLGVDYSYAVSCYRGNEVPCLRCPSCEIRVNAFKQLEMEDPLIFRLKKEGKI